MFKRLARVFKSWIGFFISFAEDPEVMLQESIEEMRNTLPKLNQILVTTRATVIRLEQEQEELAHKERQLVGSIQAALKEGSPEARRIAEDDATTLQQVRQELTATREQHHGGQNAFQNAQITVEDIKGKLRTKIEHEPQGHPGVEEGRGAQERRQRARRARHLRHRVDHRQVPRRDQAARRRVQGRRSRWPPAGSTSSASRLERKARQLQAQSILSEFEVEMGLKKPDAVREAAPFPTDGGGGGAQPTAQKQSGG